MHLLCSNFQVEFSGTKSYDKNFKDADVINVGKETKHTVTDLVPDSNYQFQVYGMSVCGQSLAIKLKIETKIAGKCLIETLM